MLGNSLEPKKEKVYSDYKLPAVLKDDNEKFPLSKSIVISFLGHPLSVWLISLILFILTFLGINPILFNKPEMKPRDIEFVLVNKEQMPIDKHTKFRSDRNSRAGGKNDPTRRISQPEPTSSASAPSQQASPQPAQKVQPSKQVAEAPAPKKLVKPQKTQMPHATNPQPPKAQPPKVKPEPPKFAFMKPSLNIPKSFPLPPASRPSTLGSGSGPITAAPSLSGSGGHGSASSGKASAPAPVISGGYGKGGRSKGSSGSYGGRGNAGNPGPGNPNGAPGIDAIKEPDFGPYMRELQRRIKANWEPPRGDESKRVVLLFKIARDGRLISLKVLKSSNSSSADKAALAAVELTAPFRRLPPEYRGNDIDIQFTFDYNVFGVGGGRY